MKIYEILKVDDEKMYLVNPFEFIYLIDKAKFVITNSFHGTVFSILSKTPFLTFDRLDYYESMKSRFETLLALFSFEERKFHPQWTIEQIMECDFSKCDAILEEERNRAMLFLTKSLDL